MSILLISSFTSCKKNDDVKATETPIVTAQATEALSDVVDSAATEAPTDTNVPENEVVTTETVNPSEEASSDGTTATEIPLDLQMAGWISPNDAISLLKTFLGSYDDNGNELVFEHESTIFKDGKYYYNFRITSLIIQEDGLAHQSYYGNYIISADGNDLEEYQPVQ